MGVISCGEIFECSKLLVVLFGIRLIEMERLSKIFGKWVLDFLLSEVIV
jgi:hypothetical protein